MSDFERFSAEHILKALQVSRIVLLSGARQTGKTTLLKALSSSEYAYRTLDDPVLLDLARSDPVSFIPKQGDKMMIDEVQRVPELLPVLKMRSDETNEKGRYLLSGSADVTALPDARESLAGRIRKVRLRGLCQAEIERNPQHSFLEKAFGDRSFRDDPELTKADVIGRALRGGFPEAAMTDDPQDRNGWYRAYIDALMTRDLQDILQIRRFDTMRQLFSLLAAWSSKEMRVSDIAAKLGVSRPTVDSYINVLSLMYMCDRLPPWLDTDYERIAKHEKIFMTDCGLAASLLDWTADSVEIDADKCGKLVETFVYNELAALIGFSAAGDYSLYHYRDRVQHEIDFILKKRSTGQLVGIEVKAGYVARTDAFKHLKYFKKTIVPDKDFTGIVLYTGPHAIAYADNMYLTPMSALWR